MTKAVLYTTKDGELSYPSLWFWCPGCEKTDDDGHKHGGLHILPVNTTVTSPSWDWDGNLEQPTLSPSILTRHKFKDNTEFVCHSFLVAGVFDFLGDCTHKYKNQKVPLPDLPDWVVRDVNERTTADGSGDG